MPILLIPNEVTDHTAVIWAGLVNEDLIGSALTLRYGGGVVPLEQNWITWTTQSGRYRLEYLHYVAAGLKPGSEYPFELCSGDHILASCRVRTLPERLPSVDERPFSVLLASCFSSAQDKNGLLGSTYLSLPPQEKPDIKILCGDQVYLDDPAMHFALHTHSGAELEDELLVNYTRTWSQMASGAHGIYGGFQQFLQNGANFFSSDDHEFWNNAPNWATLIRDSWTQAGRRNWWTSAGALLKIFQSQSPVITFKVGNLSFFIADTRTNRDPDRRNFMAPVDLTALDNWVRGLDGPGVLVVGQPIFSEKAGVKGNLTDWNLPDYAQYEELARILLRTGHSLLVLTGDVHYGRIARCQVSPNMYLYEIISSPTALVNKAVGGSWDKAPDYFPAFSIPGVARKLVENNFNYQFTKNHFLTLNFYRDGAETRAVIKTFEISGDGRAQTPVIVSVLSLL